MENEIVDKEINDLIEKSTGLIRLLCRIKRFGWYNSHPEDKDKLPNCLLAIAKINDLKKDLDCLLKTILSKPIVDPL